MTDFDRYAPQDSPVPVTGPAGASGGDGVDWTDVGKGSLGGLGRGTAGLVGLPGTVGGLVRRGLSAAGVPEEALNHASTVMRYAPGPMQMFTGPDSAEVQHGMEKVTGKFYEPHTVAGQYASTVGEFAPGMLIPGGGGLAARAFNTIVPALASETAGQLTKGTAAEPWARGAAGLVGGVGGAKLLTPTAPASAARQAAVDVLGREGIPLSAAQRTGSTTLKWLEGAAADNPLASGATQQLGERTASAYDRAITDRVFNRADLPPGLDLPNATVAAAGRQGLDNTYTQLAGRNQLRTGPTLHRDLADAQTRYEAHALPSQRAGGRNDIEGIRNDIADALVAGGGSVPGDQYQAWRSAMGTNAKSVEATQPQLAGALRDIRGALDRAMQRRLPQADREAWTLNNQRWGNMKQTEQAVASGGEHLSPQAVRLGVKSGRAGAYGRNDGNMDELVDAAASVIKPTPQSGTAPRAAWQSMFNAPNLLATSGGGVLGTVLGGPLGGVVGAALPSIALRGAVSRPGQAYLGNTVLPQRARDVVAQALLEQGVSQPSGIERNTNQQATYETQKKDERAKLGLEAPRPGYRVTRENGVTRIVPIN